MPIAVITGANRGIGLELSRQLKNQGYTIVALCRSASDVLKALDVEIHTGIELTEESGRQKAKAALKERKIDLLINNAGIFLNEKWPEIDFSSIEKQLNVNALAPLQLTQALASHFSEGSNVIMITSRMGSIADNDSGAYYGYRMSKAALNAGAKSLALDLKSKGVGVFLFHPGYVATRMTNNQGEITPDQAAKGILKTFEKLDISKTGSFMHSDGSELPW